MDLVVGEEEVDRRPPPPPAGLAVPLEGSIVGAGGDPEWGKGVGHRGVTLGRTKDIDVDVVGGARLGVVGKGERAAEGMADPGLLQRRVERNDLLRQ